MVLRRRGLQLSTERMTEVLTAREVRSIVVVDVSALLIELVKMRRYVRGEARFMRVGTRDDMRLGNALLASDCSSSRCLEQ